jgi:hypothetical protein
MHVGIEWSMHVTTPLPLSFLACMCNPCIGACITFFITFFKDFLVSKYFRPAALLAITINLLSWLLICHVILVIVLVVAFHVPGSL